jgi:hypothetical protein
MCMTFQAAEKSHMFLNLCIHGLSYHDFCSDKEASSRGGGCLLDRPGTMATLGSTFVQEPAFKTAFI